MSIKPCPGIRTVARQLAFGACLTSIAAARALAADDYDQPLHEIIVTAEKRSERLQDVPLSMTVVDASTLASQGQTQLADYAKNIPGLSFSPQDQGQTLLDIRGVSTGRGTNPTVGVTIDDVPFGPSLAFVNGDITIPDLDPSTLARVEVLRGPQGTLYGTDSMGGLVKFVTADPSLTSYTGSVQADTSSVNHGAEGESVRGAVSGPLITDLLALGLSGFWRDDPGYVNDPEQGRTHVNDQHVRGGHLSLLWRPIEAVSLKFGVLLQDVYGGGSSQIDVNSQMQPIGGDYEQNRVPGSGPYVDRVRLYTALLNVDLGFAKLTSVTGYGTSVNNSIIDDTAAFGSSATQFYGVSGATNVNYFTSAKTTEEIRLAPAAASVFEWLLGGFYEKENDGSRQLLNAVSPTDGSYSGMFYDSSFPETVREYAAFANGTYHITSQWSVQAGVRYASDQETYTEHDVGQLIGGTYDVPTATSQDRPVTWLFTLSYKLSPDLMLYTREATGYRPGGPNAGAGALGLPNSYQSDKTVNYEVGVKGSALEHALTFDADVFYVDWRDIQLTVTDPAMGFYYFENGGKARSAGAEASVQAHPFTGTTVAANFAYTDAILESDLPPGSYGLEGDRLPYSAKFSAALSVDQDVHFDAQWIGFVGATGAYTGSRLDTFAAEQDYVRPVLPAYATLDLHAGVKSENWRITAYVTNVTDTYGILTGHPQGGVALPSSPFFAVVTKPRTVGLSVGYWF